MVTNCGLANLIQSLFDDGADANAQRGGYDNALYVGAAEGHVDIEGPMSTLRATNTAMRFRQLRTMATRIWFVYWWN
jgi:hypothetical protein